MIIELDLSRHCIETASKLKREALVRACLKSPDRGMEVQIQALTHFLEHGDFQHLRSAMAKQTPDEQRAVLIFQDILHAPERLQIRRGNRLFLPFPPTP
ncbi:MAG: hypothetical protein MI747_02980 [Desulfobacterales bacterium]|nr:hypothetical protein [Desulfobacterales bacterium]